MHLWKTKHRNHDLWESTYRQYYQALCFFACKFLSQPSKSEDVVQNVFMNLLNQDIALMESAHLQNYLYKSVKNACLNELQASKRHAGIIDSIPGNNPLMASEGNLFYDIIQGEIYKTILENIEKLPPQMSQVFKLAYFDGKSNSEIASKLSLSQNTIKVHKNSAKKKLQLWLKEVSPENL